MSRAVDARGSRKQHQTRMTLPGKLLTALALGCAVLATGVSWAQDYPSRPIQFIVPSTPGTTGDQLARQLAPRLSQRWNVPVVVENKVGAGGSLGIESVAKANPDGYTFLFSATAFSTLPALRTRLPYDPVKSFAPVILLGTSPLVLAVTNSLPVHSVREFIDYTRKQPPGRLNYASPGVGGIQHLTMELFKQQTGLHLTHIPYKGMAGALNDLAAGHVEAAVAVLQTALPLAQSGRIRVLAILGPNRVAQFPQVPTLAEAGVPNIVSEAWFGLAAPAGTPPAILGRMNAEMNSLLALPDIKEALERAGVEPIGGKPEKLDALVRSELKTWAHVVKTANIPAE
jgi:tripartite-type tricarboxylate transporter receptor subunit TctC